MQFMFITIRKFSTPFNTHLLRRFNLLQKNNIFIKKSIVNKGKEKR